MSSIEETKVATETTETVIDKPTPVTEPTSTPSVANIFAGLTAAAAAPVAATSTVCAAKEEDGEGDDNEVIHI